MIVSVYSPTHLGATITSMCLAIAFTYKYENVGIHTAGMDIEIYGGFGNPTSDKITINPTPHEDISVHIYDYWSAGADYYIPVVDNSYRSLRRTVGEDMDYAICIDQPDRVLSVYDVQKCLGLSEDRLKIIRYSPAIQRACDAGLITRRMSDAEGMWSACFAIADEITNNSHTV